MASFNGTGSKDSFNGSNADDVLNGNGGKDVLAGNAGHDVMQGGGGNDTMTGNDGNDVMVGSVGKSAAVDMTKFAITEDVTAKVTFNGETAGYKNALGMYKIAADGTIYDVDVLFANASLKDSGGDLIAGKSTVDVALKAGERVGFFVVPNAYDQAGMDKLLNDANATWKMVDRGSGLDGNVGWGATKLVHVGADGKETDIKSAYGTDVFHSVSNGAGWLNPDQFKHVQGTVDPLAGDVRIGFEDLWKGGDNDFDDSIFTINVGTTNAGFLSHEGPRVAKQGDDDNMSGGDGNDKMFGMSGDDTMVGGDGNDVVAGGSGNDLMLADAGDDMLVGGSGFDTLDFSAIKGGVTVDLNKHVADGAGHDTIWGVERVVGTSFADELGGDKRANTLEGGAGDDILRGRGGADTLTGGDGNDSFVWLAKDLGTGVDHVTDFSVGDTIDLHHMFKSAGGDHSDLVNVKDTADGLVISAKIGGVFVDVVTLDGHHGASAADLLASGALLV
jgi:Ca2+-binding RTX toxin-like protein